MRPLPLHSRRLLRGSTLESLIRHHSGPPAPPALPPSRKPVIVLSGPSGSGKSTLLSRLFQTHPQAFGFSVSHTTRGPRPGETDGKDYYFTTPSAFEELVRNGAFIEHATFAGKSYGTSYDAVNKVLEAGRACVLDIEMEGVKQVKSSTLLAKFVFVKPPSIEDLEKRLRARGTETVDVVRERLDAALEELAFAEQAGVHDKTVINDDVERAYIDLEEYIMALMK